MSLANHHPWLHRYILFTAVATFFLVIAGGLVTSTGSGLAVPDWPLSYGQFFPPMVGGIFFEHGHRLVASTVGLLTLILAIWLIEKEHRIWIRRLGIVALAAVILQGVLGGLTVLFLLPTPISVGHACLGQTFFCLIVSLALFTSPIWKKEHWDADLPSMKSQLPALSVWTTSAIYLQLILGALMRHTGSGLAIPDFPLFSGRLPEFVSQQAIIHFSHRIGALIVLGFVVWTFRYTLKYHKNQRLVARFSKFLMFMCLIQIALGVLTIWTQKSVVIATSHVASGALLLATSVVLTLCAFRTFRSISNSDAVFSITAPSEIESAASLR